MTYQYIDHTADLCLVCEEDTIENIYRSNLEGMYAYLGPIGTKSVVCKKFDLKKGNQDELLVEFLNELIFWIDTKYLYFNQMKFEILTKNHLIIQLQGTEVLRWQRHIKAATYHQFNLSLENGRYISTITFDI